jgi:long-chain acyl-CoA synthetase
LAQAFVHGDSLQTFLVAIFGVQPDIFAPFASKILNSTIAADDIAAIKAACSDQKIRDAVIKDLERVSKKNKLAGFEKVKNCYLYVDPFSIDNDCLTPTLKLKRPIAAKKMRTELDKLYEEALEKEKSTIKAKL